MNKCAVLSVGQEILFGYTLDTNAAFFCNEMRALGIEVVEMRTVNDGLEDIVDAIKDLETVADIILVSGGLGPTPDDLTRQAIADAAGVELVFSEELLDEIKARFDRMNVPMVESNKAQAMLPATGSALRNNCGTAPGVRCTVGSALVFSMPGVPSEMKAMYAESVRPELIKLGGNNEYYIKRMHMCGIGESSVGDYLRELRRKYPTLEIGTTVDHYVVTVRVSGTDTALASEVTELIRAKAGGALFGEDGMTLQGVIINSLLAKNKTVALAESCTGGIIAAELVGVSGASKALLEGVVCYSNQSKINTLGVDKEIIENYGAVSARCAKAMAEGVRNKTGADYALSVTGIAGPDGGSAEKPVGTVFFAIATPEKTLVFKRVLPESERNTTRLFSAHIAMNVLRLIIDDRQCGEEIALEK